jgi:hypothetical protein
VDGAAPPEDQRMVEIQNSLKVQHYKCFGDVPEGFEIIAGVRNPK